jgi:hypothetical protein
MKLMQMVSNLTPEMLDQAIRDGGDLSLFEAIIRIAFAATQFRNMVQGILAGRDSRARPARSRAKNS